MDPLPAEVPETNHHAIPRRVQGEYSIGDFDDVDKVWHLLEKRPEVKTRLSRPASFDGCLAVGQVPSASASMVDVRTSAADTFVTALERISHRLSHAFSPPYELPATPPKATGNTIDKNPGEEEPQAPDTSLRSFVACPSQAENPAEEEGRSTHGAELDAASRDQATELESLHHEVALSYRPVDPHGKQQRVNEWLGHGLQTHEFPGLEEPPLIRDCQSPTHTQTNPARRLAAYDPPPPQPLKKAASAVLLRVRVPAPISIVSTELSPDSLAAGPVQSLGSFVSLDNLRPAAISKTLTFDDDVHPAYRAHTYFNPADNVNLPANTRLSGYGTRQQINAMHCLRSHYGGRNPDDWEYKQTGKQKGAKKMIKNTYKGAKRGVKRFLGRESGGGELNCFGK